MHRFPLLLASDRRRPAGPRDHRLRAPGAAVVLARPGARHLRAAAGGGRGPDRARPLHGVAARRRRARRGSSARGRSRARSAQGAPQAAQARAGRLEGDGAGEAQARRPGGLRSRSGNASMRWLRRSIAAARQDGYRLRPSQPELTLTQARGAPAAPLQRAAARPLQVRLDPGGRQRVGQQRPRRDHARPLHRAGVAAGAGERPEVQSEPPPERPDGHADAELRVPGRPARTTRT